MTEKEQRPFIVWDPRLLTLLEQTPHEDGGHQTDIRDLSEFCRYLGKRLLKARSSESNPTKREALDEGKRLFLALCRCLIAADRIMTVNRQLVLVKGCNDKAFRFAADRDNIALLLFGAGTLREGARALGSLRRRGVEAMLSNDSARAFGELRKIEDRWERDERFTKLRNQAAFHFDDSKKSPTLSKGLETLIEKGDPVTLVDRGGPHDGALHFVAAHDVLIAGLCPEESEFEDTFKTLVEDLNSFFGFVGQVVEGVLGIQRKPGGSTRGSRRSSRLRKKR